MIRDVKIDVCRERTVRKLGCVASLCESKECFESHSNNDCNQ